MAASSKDQEEWLKERFFQHRGNAEVVRQDLLREQSIDMSLRTVERAVAPFRRLLTAEAKATVRFETPPGRQLQIDFGQLRVPIADERVRVFLFVATLGYSRRGYVAAFRHERQSSCRRGRLSLAGGTGRVGHARVHRAHPADEVAGRLRRRLDRRGRCGPPGAARRAAPAARSASPPSHPETRSPTHPATSCQRRIAVRVPNRPSGALGWKPSARRPSWINPRAGLSSSSAASTASGGSAGAHPQDNSADKRDRDALNGGQSRT